MLDRMRGSRQRRAQGAQRRVEVPCVSVYQHVDSVAGAIQHR
ncbi:hypothetical protein L1277_000800 [Okibacterium sp. HSC-33S16]|nr:hypothetical protein [Okibacterium sp. HSC-33S16]